MQFNNMKELADLAKNQRKRVYECVVELEMETSQMTGAKIYQAMQLQWQVMREAIRNGIINEEKSASGLVGQNAKRLYTYLHDDRGGYAGRTMLKASAYAIAVSEVNAVMGKIVACPTAGSCGILPAVLYAVAEEHGYEEEEIVNALFTAAGIGMVVAQNASISGAEGGCQAECGTAAAMAAAAVVELAGGSSYCIMEGAALALKNMLGLVCDPVAGLVEVPCVKRNGFAAVQAILAADMALAGIESVIPPDEVVAAMYRIGLDLPSKLKETSQGGLADTPTARGIEARLYQ